MKFHCNICGNDFTTLSIRDKAKKRAIHGVQLNKMECPHCHATNAGYKSGGRWNPFSQEVTDVNIPPIILHPQCRPHVWGSVTSAKGLSCECDKTCKSFFNCWTGNVDDGTYNVPVEPTYEERVEKAKAHVEKKKELDRVVNLNKLRKECGNIGLSFRCENGLWYAQFGGTKWKLTKDDLLSILKLLWDTDKTMMIRNTLEKRKINPKVAMILLNSEILANKSNS